MNAMMGLQQVTAWLDQAHAVGVKDPDVLIQRVHTDSRTLAPGDLFAAR